MKLSKMLLIVLVLGFFVIPQLSYAAINLSAPKAAETPDADKVKEAVTNAAKAEKAVTDAETEGNKLASGQTLFDAKPTLFAENMIGTISLPASELQADDVVRSLADFITAGAEGKNVIILGETKEQVDLVKNKLAQILRLEGIEGERLFFAIATNKSIIDAVRDLFTVNQGAFGLCTGDNLAPAVRESLKGAV
ncbi:MAG: hypothetical protein KKB22_07885 [Candidatus Omnitrophica bacterium]|nr:hypothetical protein [Candidatus Omnitrophota bacterium]